MFGRWVEWLRATFAGGSLDREMDEEMRFHLEMQARSHREAGLDPDEARRRARIEFGGLEGHREASREARPGRALDALVRDGRFGARSLMRRPGVSVAAVLTLGMGLGATTAVYSAVNRLLLHPLPFRDADRMVFVWQQDPAGRMETSPPREVAEAWKARSRTLAGATLWEGKSMRLGGGADARTVGVLQVESGYLGFFGETPAVGRSFTEAEVRLGSPRVVMLAYGTWQRRYGGDRGAIGRTVQLDGEPYEIVGVLPASLTRLPQAGDPEYAVPLRPAGAMVGDTSGRPRIETVSMIARLGPGTTAADATRELEGIRSGVSERAKVFEGWQPHLRTVTDFLDVDLRSTLLVLMGAVALVLLVACANVAALLLSRGAARSRELAIRIALGARRGQIVRQLLVECGILATAASAVGVALAMAGVALVRRFRPDQLASLDRVAVDGRAFAFGAIVGIGTLVVFGVLPALRASRVRPDDELKAEPVGSVSARGSGRFRSGLVAGQVALSVVLLVGAGLLSETLIRLHRVDPGFRPKGLVAARLSFPADAAPNDAELDRFTSDLVARARAIPGATEATVTGEIPLHYGFTSGTLEVDGARPGRDLENGIRAMARVPPDYFHVLGVDLVEGRTFLSSERGFDSNSRVVSASFARALAPGGQAVGMRFRLKQGEAAAPWQRVVGVVEDVAAFSLEGSGERYQIYAPLGAASLLHGDLWFVVRTAENEEAVLSRLRAIVAAAGDRAIVEEVLTGDGLLAKAVAAPRFYAVLLSLFALLALALTSVGLFGVLNHAVQARTREIGVRIALGAGGRDVRRLVLRQALVPAGVGLAAGLACSVAAARVLDRLLFGVEAGNAGTRVAVAFVVAATAAIAAWLPAARAARIEPVRALNE